MLFFPCHFLSFCAFLISVRNDQKNNMRCQASKPLHTSLCKAVPAPQPPVLLQGLHPCCSICSDSPSLSLCPSSLHFSGLTAVLLCSYSHHQPPNRCFLSSLLAQVGKGHWPGKAERETNDVISDSCSCPFSLRGLASEDNRESCAYGIRQPIHFPFFCLEHG